MALTVNPEAKSLMSMVSLECYFSHRIVRSKSESIRINYKSNKERAARMKDIDLFLEENKHLAKDIIAERLAQSRQNFVAFNIRQLSAEKGGSPPPRRMSASWNRVEQQQP